MIKIKSYPIKGLYINKDVLSTFISKFWDNVFKSIIKNNSKHLMILVKVQYSEDLGYRTLGHLRNVNFEDKEQFIEYLVDRLNYLNDSYTSLSINNIIFTYIIKDGLATETRTLLQDIDNKKVGWHKFNNMNLPITMNPQEYGQIIATEKGIDTIKYIVKDTLNRIYEIISNLEGTINNVRTLGPSDLKWIDTLVTGECFKREIQKSTIYFMDGEEVLRKQIIPSKPFRKTNVERYLQEKFVTFDVETIRKDNKLVPYLICAYNGSDYAVSYADTNLNKNELFKNFLNQLVTFFKNSRKLIIYAHNLSNFDGVFLLNQLIDYGDVKPLYFNGKLMSIQVKLHIKGHEGKVLLFKDSYLLLPYSLRSLCEVFSVESIKTYFPFNLSNINYTGVFPSFKYWTNVTPIEFSLMKEEFGKRMWSFKLEAIKYCKLDCKSLHQILTIFNNEFYNKFKINAHSVLTAPALSMKLFKTHFMPENLIFQINGLIESNIRQSYTGGAVDVYIPHNKEVNKPLYYYDMNSLYPTAMAQRPMPIGQPVAFLGYIRKYEPNAYGFFYCKITSPAYLEHPILQRRIKTSEGIRTIAGLGSWEGWICSTEMDNAVKYGYTFEIIKGYQFETGDIFSKFVETLYEMRNEYPKGHPLNQIAKLMMNSLYGKFGMRNESTRADIFAINSEADRAHFRELLDIWGTTVKDWIMLDNQVIVIRDARLDLRNNPENEDTYHGTETNIAIASAVTSEARILMSTFKNNPDYTLYYSDTDSAIFDTPLPTELVGSELGQVKLEHVISKAVFLAPKVYGLITESGEEIIKIKGLTSRAIENIQFSDLEVLLMQDSTREFTQEKWHKSITKGTITVSDVAYTLKVTSNKRNPIYIDGVYNNTTPYLYDQIENISTKTNK
jgi:hypothetical protein